MTTTRTLTDEAALPDLHAGRGPDWLDDWMAGGLAEVRSWFRHLHAHPELSRQEVGTTAFIAAVLESHGLRVRLLPARNGLMCDIGSGERCVALRADLDALPLTEMTGLPYSSTAEGACHACGHDAHASIVLGAGLALAAAPSLPGRVRLIFQPAEEIMPGGALDAIAAGGLDGVDQIFALHCDPRLPVGTVGTRIGPITSACDVLELRLTSSGGHTARPHLTADLVHALGTAITDLPSLLSRRVDPRSGTVLVWGEAHTGSAPNAVPRHGVLRGTIRTSDITVWGHLEPLVRELASALMSPFGVGWELCHLRGVPPVVNDAGCTTLAREAITKHLGTQAHTVVSQSSGGEDFGWYAQQVPASFLRLGVRDDQGPPYDLHQPTFRLDERALATGVRVMASIAATALDATRV